MRLITELDIRHVIAPLKSPFVGSIICLCFLQIVDVLHQYNLHRCPPLG